MSRSKMYNFLSTFCVTFCLFLSRSQPTIAKLERECYENPPALNSSSGSGYVKNIGGLKSYVSGSLHSKLAVLLVSDIYGYEAPLLRKVADEVAAAGFYAVVPDFFHGEPFNPNNTARPKPVWLKDHEPDKGFKDAKPVIEALRQKGVHKVGAVGFCWGGKVVALLAQGDCIQAAALLHPSSVTLEDIKAVKVPIAMLLAEFDNGTPPALVKQFEQALKAKTEVEWYVKVFPGVSHGWTIRYDPKNISAVKSAEEAHQDMLLWMKKYIKN